MSNVIIDTYQDYVSVPFEAWDTKNNRQLMVSFIAEDASDLEIIFVHALDYDTLPSAAVVNSNYFEASY